MTTRNCHGTLVVLGNQGVLITGPSGSGKSTLALKLIVLGNSTGFHTSLVSDDQVLLSAEKGELRGSAPITIAGLVEVWGVGPTPIAHQDQARIDLVVKLVPKASAPRMNGERTEVLEGVAVPVIELEANNAAGAALAIMAKLHLGPFAAH